MHAKIFIDGNDALDAFPDKTGSGNQTSPYLITGFNIDAGGSGSAITMINTNRILIISSCILSGSSHVGGQGGMRLYNCQNVLVTNCTFTLNDADGIVVESCTNISLVSNHASNNTWDGIFIDDSNNCSAQYNVARDNGDDGIESRNSTNVHILHNTIYNSELQGINIAAGSSGNLVQNNTVNIAHDKGILITGDYNTVINNTVISATCISNVGQGNQLYDNICLEPIPDPGGDYAVIQMVVLTITAAIIVCFFLVGLLCLLTRRTKGFAKGRAPRESPNARS
nr:right-handed parallel beta-helix repeat-containing protein [Candidatus Sigynarchaeota archaeon]